MTKVSMKKVIYISVTGNYDRIIQPEVIDESFDYICFTDSLIKTNDGVWQFRRLRSNNIQHL